MMQMARMFHSCLTPVLAPIRWPLSRLGAWMKERAWQILHDTTIHRGIPLHIHAHAPDTSAHVITAALDRIAAVDPISFARIPHLLPGGIIADPTDYAAAWYSIKRKACVIGQHSLRLGHTDDLALSIIHEMCHARLWEAGIGYDAPALRVRVEQVCIRREIAFARKLEAQGVPQGTHTAWLSDKLHEVTQRDYTETRFIQMYRRQYLQRLRLLKSANTPRWLRRLVIAKARRRLRRLRTRDGHIHGLEAAHIASQASMT
ncbi:MAG: hypothetical protein AAFZ04_02450 [Pseudomonadota bacterium]